MTRTFAVVAIAVLGGMAFHMRWPEHSEVLDHFGGFLAGVAALFVALFAAVKGSQELEDWKHRKRHEKASEVAGQVIVAAAAFADALAVFASPAALEGDPVQADGQAYGTHLREVADARYDSIRPEIRTYGEARLLAEAYLSDAAVRHVRALWDLKTEMRQGWTRFSIGVGVPGPLAETGQQRILDAEKKLNPTVEALIAEMRKHTVGASDQGLAKS